MFSKKLLALVGFSALALWAVSSAATGISVVATPSAGGGGGAPSGTTTITNKTASFTADPDEAIFYTVDTTAGAVTITLPACDTAGIYFIFKKTSADVNSMVIDPNGSETIEGSLTLSTTVQNQAFGPVVCDGAGAWWIH